MTLEFNPLLRSGFQKVQPASGGTWGSITGSIEDQTDLQEALDLKAGLADNNTWAGTQAFSQMTEGSIPYFGANGLLSQDNQNFYWHNVAKQLDVYGSLGSEKVVNGTFASATGWTVNTGWSISGGLATHGSNGTGVLSQSTVFVNGEEYIISFTVSALTAGTVTPTFSTSVQSAISANGTYTYRIIAGANTAITFTPSNTARFSLDNVSVKLLSGGSIRTGEINLFGNHSNAGPGTTKMQRFDNSGTTTWSEYRFSGSLRAAVGVTNGGDYFIYTSSANGLGLYSGNTGLTSNSVYAYLSPSQATFYNAYGAFGGGVRAGSSGSPSSTLQSDGTVATKVKRITANQALDNTASTWLVDASSAACSGTASVACSSYTNSTDCLARDAHGGCSWFAGSDCAAYNGDQSNCEATTGCTWEMASCSGFGDESTCNSYSGCSWNNSPQDCSVYNSDQSSCESTMGCSWNFSDCSSNFFDEGSCNAQSGCSWDGMTCIGSYDTYCSGSYDSYTCDGSYSTGNCTGIFGAACSGTPSCASIDDSTSCGGETGCTWSTAVTVTLPLVTSVPDRHYWIYNSSSSGADVIIQPASGDTIDHTTSYTLASYKDFIHVQPFADLRSCSTLAQSPCGAQAGCTQDYGNCSWDSGSSICSGNAACDGINDQSTCESTTYYSGCSGSYYASKNWYVIGK